MRNNRARNGLIPMALAMLGMILPGGCTPAEPAHLRVFVTELLGNVVAALLL